LASQTVNAGFSPNRAARARSERIAEPRISVLKMAIVREPKCIPGLLLTLIPENTWGHFQEIKPGYFQKQGGYFQKRGFIFQKYCKGVYFSTNPFLNSTCLSSFIAGGSTKHIRW
jgi:hypothetical protein